MTVKEALEILLESMPPERQRQMLEFAQFLAWKDDAEGWREFGRTQFERAYAPDEPEYSEADLRPGSDS